jgi:hypothetical protein
MAEAARLLSPALAARQSRDRLDATINPTTELATPLSSCLLERSGGDRGSSNFVVAFERQQAVQTQVVFTGARSRRRGDSRL